MNLAEMIAFVRKIRGDNASSQYDKDDDIVLMLNQSALSTSSKTLSLQDFAKTTTVAGTERYPVPFDFLALMSEPEILDGSTIYRLERLNYDEYRDIYPTEFQQRPIHYRMELGATDTVAGAGQGDIWLRPIPDKEYELTIPYFQRTSNLLVTDLDKSYELRIPFHEAICYHAAMKLSFSLKDAQQASIFKGLYDQAIFDANQLVANSDKSEPFKFEKAYGLPRHSWRRRR